MTKNTIDDQLSQYMLFGCECGRLDSETIADVLGGEVTEKLKQALYQDLMALVGEDEPFKNLYQWQQAEPINLEKQRIRQNINQYFKRGEGDEGN